MKIKINYLTAYFSVGIRQVTMIVLRCTFRCPNAFGKLVFQLLMGLRSTAEVFCARKLSHASSVLPDNRS